METGNIIAGLVMTALTLYGLLCSVLLFCDRGEESPGWMQFGYLVAFCMQILLLLIFVFSGFGVDMGLCLQEFCNVEVQVKP